MRKKILPLGLLLAGVFLNAQVAFVGNQANFNVKPETIVYSDGTVKVKGDGTIINQGNFKVNQGGLITDKNTGENFILKLNDLTDYKSYGQLWINESDQSQIKGIIRKEFKATNNGDYQQIALPFENKSFSELSSELGKNFSTNRWSENEILVYNNANVRFDHIINLSNKTNSTNGASGNYRSSYYAIGAKNANFTNLHNVKGKPFSSGNQTIQLSGAPTSGIDFGVDGNGINAYGEKYNTYLYDGFNTTVSSWTGDYGKAIYQFGNPFLTNLDLSKISSSLQVDIKGIRVELTNVQYDNTTGTKYSKYKYITFNNSGAPVGDVNLAIVKPMGTFVVKMKPGKTGAINLSDLRTFSNSPSSTNGLGGLERNASVNDHLTELDNGFKSPLSNSIKSVKQLGVIALDEEGKELGRTYYVVYPEAYTGTGLNAITQVKATGSDIIGTYEEKLEGGYDSEVANNYWLYINEANENDFKGKDILLALYNDKIKNLKFEIRENARLINDAQERLSTNESFYISSGEGNLLALQQNSIYPVSKQFYSLYYGKPENSTLDVSNGISKPSDCLLVYDKNISRYRLIFDPSWVEADIEVHDMAGRTIISKSNYKTNNDFIINLPEVQSTYIVTALSNKGEKFSQKITK